jgi:hypothetical protein
MVSYGLKAHELFPSINIVIREMILSVGEKGHDKIALTLGNCKKIKHAEPEK